MLVVNHGIHYMHKDLVCLLINVAPSIQKALRAQFVLGNEFPKHEVVATNCVKLFWGN